MNIVLRCPNCGTAQATAGECDACHEAQVRYFCTKHESWLDGPTCPQDVAPAPRPARPVPRPPALPVHRVDEASLSPSRQALWERLLRGAVRARLTATPERPPAAFGPGGWLMRLVLRFLVIGVVLIVAIAGVLYWLATSMQ